MARLVFIAIVTAIIVVVWRGRDSAHGRAWKRIMLLGFAALVIVTILFPATTSVAAEWIGIGRGADLVFYMTSFAVMFLAAMVYLKFKRLEDRIASIVSDQALREWDRERVMGQPPHNGPPPAAGPGGNGP